MNSKKATYRISESSRKDVLLPKQNCEQHVMITSKITMQFHFRSQKDENKTVALHSRKYKTYTGEEGTVVIQTI